MPDSPLHRPVLRWYDLHARDLPWREPAATPWQILVSEVMLQQTQVSRVLPAYTEWVDRWPTAAALAAERPGEAVRQWGRLGYPRRALRLHACATAIVDYHDGEVPTGLADLLDLPGVGEYTAAAVASFAFGQRHPVLDTNVRRVFARAIAGTVYPPTATTAAERTMARSLLPDGPERAARWAVAVMEVGALVCTARAPSCEACPIRTDCAWRLLGRPEYDGPPRRSQRYAGTDRQCRGTLLQVLRDSSGPVHRRHLEAAWSDAPQRERALDSLVADGLVDPVGDDQFALT